MWKRDRWGYSPGCHGKCRSRPEPTRARTSWPRSTASGRVHRAAVAPTNRSTAAAMAQPARRGSRARPAAAQPSTQAPGARRAAAQPVTHTSRAGPASASRGGLRQPPVVCLLKEMSTSVDVSLRGPAQAPILPPPGPGHHRSAAGRTSIAPAKAVRRRAGQRPSHHRTARPHAL